MSSLFEPLQLTHGPTWSHRITLGPLTNCQSHADGTLSEEEYRWLTMRAQGGFSLTMTCASHVMRIGQGFPGQLGCFGDEHIPGLTRLADGIRAAGSVSSVQLHHAGIKSPPDLIGTRPVGPSDEEESGARGMTLDEVLEVRDAFVAAAIRAEKAGFDGVELHGAHSYLLSNFLSSQFNKRTDEYGGNQENRERLLFEILHEVRRVCRPDFQIGVRISPDKFGIDPHDAIALAGRLLVDPALDYLDVSMWDCERESDDETLKGKPFLQHFIELPRKGVALGAAGKIYTGTLAQKLMDQGLDFVTLGKSAVLHHDWPKRIHADLETPNTELPVTREYLSSEGLGPAMVEYMSRWKGFVSN